MGLGLGSSEGHLPTHCDCSPPNPDFTSLPETSLKGQDLDKTTKFSRFAKLSWFCTGRYRASVSLTEVLTANHRFRNASTCSQQQIQSCCSRTKSASHHCMRVLPSKKSRPISKIPQVSTSVLVANYNLIKANTEYSSNAVTIAQSASNARPAEKIVPM